MSFALYPVQNSDPEVVVKEIESVFGLDKGSPVSGVLRFVPNRRLSAVLAISSTGDTLARVGQWIERFDRLAAYRERRMFVYKIQNRPAKQLAELLQRVFTDTVIPESSKSGKHDKETIAPRFVPGRVASAAGQPPIQKANPLEPLPTDVKPLATKRDAGNSKGHSVKIVADEENNALLIRANPRDYRRILRILERLDVLPTQILLEAVIAEVSLTDDLRFGVKWYFRHKNNSFTLTDAATGVIASSFPGFSYFFELANVQLALDALSGITKVNIVSSPSLVVMDNRVATLQIGDQVPIITRTAQSVTDPNAPVVNSVELKDTGIILKVKPRLNGAGHIVLQIAQEVSSVTRTVTSGIDSPTIQQRRINTTVVVGDGEVIALGGLVQKRDSVGKSQIPVLAKIPVIGSAFRQKTDDKERIELVIFIRPKIMRNVAEAQQITEEFRRRLQSIRPHRGRSRNAYERDLRRAVR